MKYVKLGLRGLLWLAIIYLFAILFVAVVGLSAEANNHSIFRVCNTVGIKWDLRVDYSDCKE